MGGMTPGEIRTFLANYLAEKLRTQGRDFPSDFSDDSDILLLGLVDSLDLLQLMSALGAYCGREIDFEELDPEQMTVVGSLCRYVSEQATRGPSH
jgi:acyl carrier protein